MHQKQLVQSQCQKNYVSNFLFWKPHVQVVTVLFSYLSPINKSAPFLIDQNTDGNFSNSVIRTQTSYTINANRKSWLAAMISNNYPQSHSKKSRISERLVSAT